MALKIWGRDNSNNVQKVLWTCAELGLAYDRVDAGGQFGGLDTPEYLAMNPNARIPVINDDGFVLWEANAIVRYLAAKHDSGGLYPTDLQVRADAERWMDWQTNTYWPAFFNAFWGVLRTPPEQQDPQAIAASAAATGDLTRILDKYLAGHDFVVGDRLTIADIPAGVAVDHYLRLDGIDHPTDIPNVRAWQDRLAERAGFRDLVMLPLT